MNNQTFGFEYSKVYDTLYQDKDYEHECDVIQELLRLHGSGEEEGILDLGCGTGGHAIPLASRGYSVHGIDLSAEMLGIAAEKVVRLKPEAQGQAPTFSLGDIKTAKLGYKFDAAIMMFAVLGYQYSNNDVIAALTTAHHHLNPQGLFLCDFWYGPAVLNVGPQDRVRIIDGEHSKIIRTASTELEHQHHLAHVKFNVWEIQKEQVLMESVEIHTMRYFFPMEVELLLETTGFQTINLYPFPRIDQQVDSLTWNVIAVARKR